MLYWKNLEASKVSDELLDVNCVKRKRKKRERDVARRKNRSQKGSWQVSGEDVHARRHLRYMPYDGLLRVLGNIGIAGRVVLDLFEAAVALADDALDLGELAGSFFDAHGRIQKVRV